MALINQTPTTPVDGESAINSEWKTFFGQAYQLLSAMTQSGTSINRPSKLLWVGRRYFDTTLGIPVYYKGPGWVTAAGAAA